MTSINLKILRQQFLGVSIVAIAGLIRCTPVHAINIQFVNAGSGFTQPVFMTHAGDSSGRRFVVERGGKIRIIDISGTLLAADFLNVGSTGQNLIRTTGTEQGLLGLAFDPNFSATRKFYIYYTRSGDGASIIARHNVPAGTPDVADPTETIVFGPVSQPQANHNGGGILFGPDNYLYIGMGDGGGGGDTGTGHDPLIGNGQSTGTLLGKMLRIDVSAAPPYSIPPTNPFVSSGPSTKKEIFAYGLRNPWRYSFDRLNGRLFCGDVGQDAVEEIDLITKGGNYGWRRMEGSSCYNPSTGCQTGSLILPIYEYTHAFGCSVTGGYVYRGGAYPALRGLYFYADYCNGSLWTLQETAPNVWSSVSRTDAPFSISSFGEDEDGELYVCDYGGGNIYKITDTDPQPTPTPPPNAIRNWAIFE